jgi:hypothetical protein
MLYLCATYQAICALCTQIAPKRLKFAHPEMIQPSKKHLYLVAKYDVIVDRGRAVGVGPSPVKQCFNP